jgi:hypothetical protein
MEDNPPKTQQKYVHSGANMLVLLVTEDGIKLRYGEADHIVSIMQCTVTTKTYLDC